MPKNVSRNNSSDHFISPTAHYLEEAIGALYAIEKTHSEEVPDAEVVRLKIIRDHLSRAYKREAKRQGKLHLLQDTSPAAKKAKRSSRPRGR